MLDFLLLFLEGDFVDIFAEERFDCRSPLGGAKFLNGVIGSISCNPSFELSNLSLKGGITGVKFDSSRGTIK